MDSKKPIDISNMGMIAHSYDKLSEGEHIVLRIGDELYRGRYLACSHSSELHSLRDLPDHATFKFTTFPFNKHVIGKLSKHSGKNRSRRIIDNNTGKRINIFVERVGKYSGLRAYRDWKRNECKFSREEPEVIDVPAPTSVEIPEVICKTAGTETKSAVIPFTKLPVDVLETIARCKLNGTLTELIRVSKEVQEENKKLGITISIEL